MSIKFINSCEWKWVSLEAEGYQSFRTHWSFVPRRFVPRLRHFVPSFDQFLPNPLDDSYPTNYDIFILLHCKAIVSLQICPVSERKLKRMQSSIYCEVQRLVFELWEAFNKREKSLKQLLNDSVIKNQVFFAITRINEENVCVCFRDFESYNLLGTNHPERTSTARKFFSGLRGKPFDHDDSTSLCHSKILTAMKRWIPFVLRSSGRVSTIYGSAGIWDDNLCPARQGKC